MIGGGEQRSETGWWMKWDKREKNEEKQGAVLPEVDTSTLLVVIDILYFHLNAVKHFLFPSESCRRELTKCLVTIYPGQKS